jgi:hypothetical protein
MKKKVLLFLMLALFACKEDEGHKPLGESSDIPGALQNVRIKKNIAGGAIITFDLPDNSNVFYVKAEYTNSQGEQKDVLVSSYVDTLTIKGLGDTNERIVRIYAVNRQEQASSPTEITIHPLKPSVAKIKESLTYATDFGGFMVDFENEDEENISINILVRDSTGSEMEYYDALFTSKKQGRYAVRNLPPDENLFGLFVRDRWNNFSDTLYFSLTPWKEDYLDKKLFRFVSVAGDDDWERRLPPSYMWDDVIHQDNYGASTGGNGFPCRFSMDLGVTVQLSRFKLYQRPHPTVIWQHGSPYYYKVYGCVQEPPAGNLANPMEGWTLLRECYSEKPSGLPVGQTSSEDMEYAALGEEYSIPLDVPAVRYIRFEFIETWGGLDVVNFSELSFWGDIKK